MNDFKQQVRCTFVGSNQYGGEWVSSAHSTANIGTAMKHVTDPLEIDGLVLKNRLPYAHVG